MTHADARSHDQWRAELAEFALGILDGRARVELVDHLEGCDECAAALGELNEVVDALVRIPSGAEPSVGFETRVMERVRASRRTLGPTRRRRVLASIAATLVVVSVGVGWTLGHVTASHRPLRAAARVEQRTLQSSNRHVGLVYADVTTPSWMFVIVNAPGAPGDVRCVVVTTSGRRDAVGTFALTGGRGAWGVALPVSFGTVRDIELTATDGTLVAHFGRSGWHPSGERWS